MTDPRKVTAEIKRIMDAGEPLTARDLSDLANAARMSGRMDHKLLYVNAKAYKAENNGDKEPTADEIKAGLVEALELAQEKAERSGNKDDMVAYVNAKAALANAELAGGEEETE